MTPSKKRKILEDIVAFKLKITLTQSPRLSGREKQDS